MEAEELGSDNRDMSSIAQRSAKAREVSQTSSKKDDVTSIAAIAKGLTSNKHLKWLLAAVALMLVVVVGFVFLNQGQTSIGDGYEVANQKLVREDSIGHITGIVKNTCGRTETLMMTWTLYDADNNEVGTAMAVVENLPDQASEGFEAFLMVDDGKTAGGASGDDIVTSFKLKDVLFMKAENARLDSRISAL